MKETAMRMGLRNFGLLFLAIQAVKDHTHNIFLKTGVRKRVELINVIREHKKV